MMRCHHKNWHEVVSLVHVWRWFNIYLLHIPFLYSLVICDSPNSQFPFYFFPWTSWASVSWHPHWHGGVLSRQFSCTIQGACCVRVRAGWFFCQIGPLWLLCGWISVMSYMPLKVQTHCPSFSIFVAKLIKPIAEMTSSVRLMEVSSTWLRPTAAILLSWDVLSNGEKSSSPDSQLITAILATLQSKVRGTSLKSCIFPGFS